MAKKLLICSRLNIFILIVIVNSKISPKSYFTKKILDLG